MKSCNYCKEELSYDHYSVNKSTKDGYSNRCKGCMSKIRNAKRVTVPRIKYDVNRVEKTCKGCKEILPMESFGKSKVLADGRENTCTSCRMAKRKANASSGKFADKDEKRCSYCKETLPIVNFVKDRSRDDGHSAVCRDCKRREHGERYKSDSAYREKRKAAKAKWRSENIGVARERERAYANKHNKTLEGKLSKYKYNAKKRNFEWSLTDEQFSAFWQNDCSYCGDAIETLGIDRIDSSKGYTMDNVAPCCEVCNRVKMAHSTDFLKSHLEKMIKNMEQAK